MEKLNRKYGLMTGIAMVVGIVIGSGVFFKADNVLLLTDGKLSLALLAWLIGGLIMVISAFCFATMSTRVEKVNGVVDYVEQASNKKFGYVIAWYMTTIYLPIILSILAFVSSTYIFTLFGIGDKIMSLPFWIFVVVLITLSFIMNTISPKIAGYFQVSTTIIKLIPIAVVVICGTVYGLINGTISEAFNSIGNTLEAGQVVSNDFGGALLATIFAYEGWVIATSINAELKDSKKNLPKALVFGTIIVIAAYLLYYLGLSLFIPNTNEIISLSDNAPLEAVSKLFGNVGKVIFNILIIISCLGTLNGLTMGSCRAMYAIGARNQGPAPHKFNKLHPKANMSIGSSIFGYCCSLIILGFWYLGLNGKLPLGTMDELCIAVLYLSYISIYIWIIKNCKDLNWFSRYFMPIAAIAGSILLTFASTGLFTLVTTGSFDGVVRFLTFMGITGISLLIGMLFYSDKKEIEPTVL